jgi:hypothetical protein
MLSGGSRRREVNNHDDRASGILEWRLFGRSACIGGFHTGDLYDYSSKIRLARFSSSKDGDST